MSETRSKWRRYLTFAIEAILLGIFGHATYITCDGFDDDPQASDVIVILGNMVNPDGTPSERLADRLDKGLEIYQRHKPAKVIVSGGVDEAGTDEAAAMAKYLAERGVPRDVLVEDPSGANTWMTAQFVARFLAGWKNPRVTVVSQYYHISRTKLALSRLDIDAKGAAADYRFSWRDPYSILRELIAYYYYIFAYP